MTLEGINGVEVLLGATPSFLASMVEFVEALTIVLVVGVTRGWRPSLLGSAAAVLVLGGVVLVFGGAVRRIPEHTFQIVVGTLLLLFGLRWLRKAILRYAGVVALHDEEVIFKREASKLRGAPRASGFDFVAATISFKATALEGLEVIFIVLALGAASSQALHSAIIGAGLALVLVVGTGVALKKPLTRVPENTLKASVACLLVSFGIFWSVEGFGATWPGDAASLPVLIGLTAAVSWWLVRSTRAAVLVPSTVEV